MLSILIYIVQQEDDDVDPLDAFMVDVNKEVNISKSYHSLLIPALLYSSLVKICLLSGFS